MSVTHVSRDADAAPHPHSVSPIALATSMPDNPPSPSATEANHVDAKPKVPSERDNVLAQMQFTSVNDSDLTPSEDESPEERSLQLETVQSAIGVSIGQQQTRLTSPKTPAAEKAAALDETDGSVLFEGWEQPVEPVADEQSDSPSESDETPQTFSPKATAEEENQTITDNSHSSSASSSASRPAPAPRLPSPWRAGPKPLKIQAQGGSSNHRSALRDSFVTKVRRRTLSGGSSMGESIKKYFNLPSLHKTSGLLSFSLPSFSASQFDNVRASTSTRQQPKQLASGPARNPRASIHQYDGSSQSTLQRPTPRRSRSLGRPTSRRSRSLSRLPHPATAPPLNRELDPVAIGQPDIRSSVRPPPSVRTHSRPTPVLRKSNSEGSLLMYRTRSIASSLGDDSRFENVSEMVNSRMKAIKDSWQDANFKLSVPSLPNFNFASRDDLFRSSKTGSPVPQTTNANAAVYKSRLNTHQRSTGSISRLSSLKPSKAGAASTDTLPNNTTTHPNFARALQELEGDLVILGGYRGSILRSAEPPHRQLWVPIKVGLNLRKVDLEVGLEPEDELSMEERIIPGGMLTHIGPVDIGKRLLKRLRASENARSGKLRVHNYGYDWRLSPHLLAQRMIKFLEELPCNQPGVPPEKRGAIVLAHSLGGLITRHVINQRPDLVSGVVYAGVPQNCINILGPLRNGDDVLLSSRVLTAQVNFTIRTSFALLPLDGKCFINKHTKEEYPLDFFDVNTWDEHRLSPCIAPAIPASNVPPPSNYTVSGILNAMSQALPSRPSRKSSVSRGANFRTPTLNHQDSTGTTGTTATTGTTITTGTNSSSFKSNPSSATSGPNNSTLLDTARNATSKAAEGGAQATGFEPSMQTDSGTTSTTPNPATTVTIPKDKAVKYLARTLSEIKQFKEELAHNPTHTEANAYPPIALIYGKSTPTVYGAKVENREAIKLTSCYDELAFASGDGVVLAKAAMVPHGYSVVRGGVVPSERGHVTLLGDLEAVGKCLVAVIKARKLGVGLGRKEGEKRSGGGMEKDVA